MLSLLHPCPRRARRGAHGAPDALRSPRRRGDDPQIGGGEWRRKLLAFSSRATLHDPPALENPGGRRCRAYV